MIRTFAIEYYTSSLFLLFTVHFQCQTFGMLLYPGNILQIVTDRANVINVIK